MPVYTGDKFGFGKSPDDGGGSAQPGEAFFPEPGQYDWVCPAGITKICAVCIGGGGGATRDEMGGAGGGGLGYKNNITVTPGETYKIQVGAGGAGDVYMNQYGCSGGDSWFINATTVKGGGGGGTGCAADGDHTLPGYGGRGGTYVGDGGGNGGNGGDGNRSSISGTGADTGGGGAGGYGGDGGQGGDYNGNWNSGTAGNNGAGGGGCTAAGGSNEYWGGGGGGVTVYGKGRNGGTGSNHQHDWQSGGIGGSGGAAGWGNGGNAGGTAQVNGGQYGGGGGSTDQRGGIGASGAVRLIWGTGREFPSNGADDFWSETITRYTASSAGDTTATSSNWFRGGLGEEDNSNYSSNFNYNGIVPNISGHGNLDSDFTIECWIYVERLVDNTQTFGSGTDGWGAVIMDGRTLQNSSSNQLGSWWISRGDTRRGSTGPYFINYAVQGGGVATSDTECIQQCTWHHVALTRQDNTYWMWVDGVKVKSAGEQGPGGTGGTPTTIVAQSDRPVIGGWGYGGRMHFWSWYGNISNFRISKNLALYDGAGTTYTVPTFPLTTTLPGQGGGGASSNSVQFSNGNDYLTVGSSSDLAMGSGDFTVECWARFDDTSNRGLWQVEGLTTNYTTTMSFAHNGSNWHGYRGGSTWDFGSSRSTNQWYHCAYVKNGSTCTIYIDGTSIGTWSDSYNYQGTTLAIGGYYTTGYLMNGNISNFRMVKGQALYTQNFTPTTEPLTTTSQGAIESNVKLLCCNKSTPTGKDVGPSISNGQGSPSASSEHPYGAAGPSVEVLCCGVDDDYEKDLTGSRVWSGPNCMPSVLGPGEPTEDIVKKGYRIWGRHRGLGGGTQNGQNGSAGDGGLLSTWKKSTGSFQTEQFGTHGGWSASATNADGIAIKVIPGGSYATGDNATAKWNLGSIAYGMPSGRPRNNSLGFGPFIPNVHIKVMEGKNTSDTVIYDSGQFTLRIPSYNDYNSNGGTPSKERYTSGAFEIVLPNGGANDLDMDTWYSVYIKGLAHPNGSNWNSTNGTPGANKSNYWYSEQPVSYSSNSGSYNEMRYAPSTSGDSDAIVIRLEQANFNDTSWANNNHASFNPLGQSPFFGISMPINFMKDPIPTSGGGGSSTTYYKATPDNTNGNSYVNLGANLFPSNAYLTYTVEVWCRPLTSPSGQCWIVDQHPGGSGRLFMGADSGNLAFFSGGMYNTSTSFGSTGSWAHLAFVANGNGSVTIFKDGTLIGTSGTGQISTSPDNQNTLWGQDTTYGGFNCEYRGFRINSNRVYTSNFTPPDINGGLTNISGTLALWDGLTGNATDASGNNTWSATNMTFSEVSSGGSGSPTHVTNGLIFNVDASDSSSYSGSGSTWTDIQGSNNVTLTNCSYSSSNGGGITFDGVSQWSIGEFTTPFSASDYHTWEVWTNGEWTTGWPGSSYTWILHNSSQGQSTGSSYMTIGINDANQFFGANDGKYGSMNVAAHTSTNSIIHHLVLTWDGSTQKFYVNGTLGNSTSLSAYSQWQNNVSFNTTTTMGEAIGGNYRPLKGNIYSVRCWNRALTSAEVTTNWNGNKAKFGH